MGHRLGDTRQTALNAYAVRFQDDLTPSTAVEETARRLGTYAEVKHYPIRHYDYYFGDKLETSVADQVECSQKHLRASKGSGSDPRAIVIYWTQNYDQA
jgi:hypothetical protein